MLTNQKMNIGKQLKKEGTISILHDQKIVILVTNSRSNFS